MSIHNQIQDKLTFLFDTVEENRRARYSVYAFLGIILYVVIPNFVAFNLIDLLTRGLIFGLFAMGYDFMYGYSGMVSFGHAALFGIGAYAFAVALTLFGVQSVWILLLLAVVVAALYSFVVGVISIRTREVYFAILTLAFAEVFRILIIQYTDITGGADGLTMNLAEWSVVPGVVQLSLYDTVSFYYVVVTAVVLTYLLLRRLTNSPLGSVMRGVRENIDRLAYIGINERRYRIFAFTVSGAVSGLAGALYAIDISFIGPNILEPVMSGEVILWTIIGGKATLVGPILGGALIYFVEDTVSAAITWWLIPVGLFFIAVIILAPQGLAGLVMSAVDRIRR